MDKADLFDKLSRIRRATVNADVLAICDALAAHLTNPIVVMPASQDTPPPMIVPGQPPSTSKCPVCEAKRQHERTKKARNRKRKGATSRQSKGALRPIIPTTNNAPATS